MAFSARTSQLICLAYIVTVSTMIVRYTREQFDSRDVLKPDTPALTFVLPFEQTALASASQDTGWDMRFSQPNAIDERLVPRTPATIAYEFAAEIPTRQPEEIRLPTLISRERDRQASRDAGGDANARDLRTSAVQADTNDVAVPASQSPHRERVAVSPPSQPRDYRVVAGDNLHRIVQKHYGSYSSELAQRLIQANPELAEDPDLIRIGQHLVIPHDDRRADSTTLRTSTYRVAAG